MYVKRNQFFIYIFPWKGNTFLETEVSWCGCPFWLHKPSSHRQFGTLRNSGRPIDKMYTNGKEEHTFYVSMHGPFHVCLQSMCADHLRSSFISFSETQTSSIVTLFDDFFWSQPPCVLRIRPGTEAWQSNCFENCFLNKPEANNVALSFSWFNKSNNPCTNCNPSRAVPSGSCQRSCRLLPANLGHSNRFFSFWPGTTCGPAA